MVALLLWAAAGGVARAQPGVPPVGRGGEPPVAEGPDGLGAPSPRQSVPTPPASYGTTRPAPPMIGPQAYDAEVAVPPEPRPSEPVDPDRRAGSEMIELYVTSSFYTAFATAYLLSLDGALSEEEANFIVLGALVGPGTVVALDLATDGFRTGVPPAIAMGLLGGVVEAGLLSNQFDLVDSDEGVFGLITASMTVGGLLGGIVGTQLRPSVADVRLVASMAGWGLYFTGLASVAVNADDEGAATALLVGFNAGALLGVVLAPYNELSAGQVMLLDAGLGIGTAAGAMVTTLATADDFDEQTITAGMGIGALAGLVVTYLLVRPDDPVASDATQTAARRSTPYVAPTPDGGGAVVGVSGVM